MCSRIVCPACSCENMVYLPDMSKCALGSCAQLVHVKTWFICLTCQRQTLYKEIKSVYIGITFVKRKRQI